ncbi:MAG: trypsin-like peptidase domain-containing protein [Gemmatimonadota bacterium]|nr:trypsin-like peptidase domain-containing protein [Gemmatimonadota bacterium]MDE2783964.1 trypsin-like peptidase domain-containing protein [Gemmatimonadota bacterium]MDE2865032.1 trypsin-like peptidase domain-containing protein [Gemmatimonadota bacterium]MXX56994.1 PDZ domain-containing protein [Gemmatimonadota bacterium]MYC91305.1 PDZ domain-containing protein [Gemmatimonadota bacterium]
MYDPLRAKTKVALSVAASFLVGLGIASQFGFTDRPFTPPPVQTAPVVSQAEVQPALDLSQAFVNVADAVTPAVVRIVTTRQQVRRSSELRGWERLFGVPPRDVPDIAPGSGSGFVISDDGYILTNNHVVEDAQQIDVTLLDGREFGAQVVGTDPTTDIAVIKIDGTDLPVASLGSSAEVRVGEWVLAIGNPGFGRAGANLDYTVTAGIVSAKGRSLRLINRSLEEDPDYSGNSALAIEDFIQTDAVINQGNSGGPMVNLQGQVIGINAAIVSATGVYQGYGFAVPIDLAHRVMDDLIAYGRVKRAFLGVSIWAVSAEDAEAMGLPDVSGALVQGVNPGTPAERAGLRFRDVIREVDGEKVLTGNDLQHKIALKSPGDQVRIAIYRDGRPREVTVRLEEMPYSGEVAEAPSRQPRAADRIGIVDLVDVTPEIARQLQLESTDGVVVAEVQPNGPAYNRGIVRTCVITEIERREIQSEDDVSDVLEDVAPGEVVSVVAACPSTDPGRNMAPTLYNIRVPR